MFYECVVSLYFTDIEIAFKANAVKVLLELSQFIDEPGTLKFENVLLNYGNAFNHTSGIFVTPVSGMYIFAAHLCGGGNITSGGVAFGIFKSTSTYPISSMFIGVSSTIVCSTTFGLAELYPNDEIGVIATVMDDEYDINAYNNDLNFFLGSLLKAY